MVGRNPTWARDELILALDLYLRRRMPGSNDPDVIELSQLLNALPIHATRPDLDRFRNPSGVALKLANYGSLDPAYEGAGMSRIGHADREVWDEYHDRPGEVARLAGAIRIAAATGGAPDLPEPDEDEAEEGRLLYRRHRTYERDRRLVAKKKAAVRAAGGRLVCEACSFDFGVTYGDPGRGFIECHHLRPLHETGRRRSRLSDLALLCANCHRMAHRVRPWPSVADLRSLLRDR